MWVKYDRCLSVCATVHDTHDWNMNGDAAHDARHMMLEHDKWPFQETLESRSAEDSGATAPKLARIARAPETLLWPAAQHKFFLS